jgi:hypothetical protein
MMQIPKGSRDDLLDVMELTDKLQQQIANVLNDNLIYLSMPALIAATINCMLSQCDSIEQAHSYRDLFVSLFGEAIKDHTVK